MRLNVGCGGDIKPGYTNVDFRALPGVDVVHDLTVFPWPFPDESAEEILLLDVLEHFPYRLTPLILMECFRILIPSELADAHLIVQVPDARHLTRAIAQEGVYLCNRCGAQMWDGGNNFKSCHGCGQTADECSYAAMRRLYGGQDYPGNTHQVCFTAEMLELQCRAAGFGNPETLERDHQFANWNLKYQFVKCDLW